MHRLGNDDLARLEAGDLRREPGRRGLGELECAGRDVEGGNSVGPVAVRGPHSRNGDERVGARRIEKRILGDRARGHEPGDVTPNDGFRAALSRLGRVLELLADGDPMALRDEPLQIFVGAVHRDAAHRDVHAVVPSALGQHDAERATGDLGILEEQLVEIAHPIEEKAIGIGGLDLDELRHDG